MKFVRSLAQYDGARSNILLPSLTCRFSAARLLIAQSDDKAIAYPFKVRSGKPRTSKATQVLICDPLRSLQADVSSGADVEKLFNRASEMSHDLFQQPPSILVNCAGITRDGWIANLTEGEVRRS